MGWFDGLWRRMRRKAATDAANAAVDRVKRAAEAAGTEIREMAERELEKGRASSRMREAREEAEAEARRRAFDPTYRVPDTPLGEGPQTEPKPEDTP